MGLTQSSEPENTPDKVAATRALLARQEAEQQERIKFLRSVVPEKKKSRTGKVLGWTFLVLLLAAGGFAGWKYIWQPRQVKPAVTQKAPIKPTEPIAAKTKHIDSNNLSLGFDYPADWKVSDQDGKPLVAVSPPLELKSAQNQTVTTQIVFTIKPHGAALPEFDDGNAKAARASEKITYAKPSSSQRADSYLSFLNYANSRLDGLDGIYVTGDSGYQSGQAIPQVDIAKADPLITLTFQQCQNATCTGKSDPLTINTDEWLQADFSGPLKKMLTSVVVQ